MHATTSVTGGPAIWNGSRVGLPALWGAISARGKMDVFTIALGDVLGKKKQRRKPARQAQRAPGEDQRSEVVTVAWMLSTLVTLGALVLSGLVLAALPWLADDPTELGPMRLLPGLMLIVATITATVAMILMAIALRFRRSRPPRLIIVVATVICMSPFGLYLLLAFR